MDSYHPQDTIDFLTVIEKRDLHYFLYEGSSVDEVTIPKVPMLFYQGMFTSGENLNTVLSSSSDNSYSIESHPSLGASGLSFLEELLYRAKVEKGSRRLYGEISCKAVENILRRKDMDNQILKNVFTSLVKINNSELEKTVRFPIFDKTEYDKMNDKYIYHFSESISILYATEKSIKTEVWGATNLSPTLSYIIKYVLSSEEEEYVPVSEILLKINMLHSDTLKRKKLLSDIRDELEEKGKLSKIKKEYGVNIDLDGLPIGKEMIKVGRRARGVIITPKRQEEDFFHAVLNNDVDTLRIMTMTDQEMNEENIEDEVSRRVAEKLSDEVDKALKKHKTEYIDFGSLSIKQGDLLDIAEENGFTKAEASIILSSFSDWYISKSKKMIKKTSLNRLWGDWINNAEKDKKWKIVPKERMSDVVEPNRGYARNIVYDDKIEKILREEGIEDLDGREVFKKFKNHFLALNVFMDDWLPRFQNWVMEHKEIVKTRENKGVGGIAEENYYLALIVHNDVASFIENAGYSVESVLQRELEIEEVAITRVTVPPKYGKGERYILSFKDQRLNDKILDPYIRKYEKPQPTKVAKRTLQPIDAEILEKGTR